MAAGDDRPVARLRGLKVSAHQYCRRHPNTVGDAAERNLCHASPQSVKRSVRPRNSAWPITSPTAPCPLTRWHVAREVRRAPPFGSCGPPQRSTKIEPGNRWPPLGRARQRTSRGWSWRVRRRMRMLDFSRNSDQLHRLYTTRRTHDMTVSKNDVFAEIGVDLRPDSELTREEIIARNLKVVDVTAHTENYE